MSTLLSSALVCTETHHRSTSVNAADDDRFVAVDVILISREIKRSFSAHTCLDVFIVRVHLAIKFERLSLTWRL